MAKKKKKKKISESAQSGEPLQEARGPGHPTHYDPIYCEMLIKHMEDGLSFEAFAGVIGVCEKTLYNWAKAHPEFLQSKKLGKAKSLKFWEEQGVKGLYNETIKDGDGMTITRSINATVWIFNMKNRFGWRDKPKDEEEDDKAKASSVQLSNEQLIDLVKKAREKE